MGEWAAGDLQLRRRRGEFSLRDSSKAELVLQGQTHDFELKQTTTETDVQIQVGLRSYWRCIETQIGHHSV